MADNTPITGCSGCATTGGRMSCATHGGNVFVSAESHRLRMPCGFAAPLVVNGAAFVGCQLEKGHDGQHSITIKWGD